MRADEAGFSPVEVLIAAALFVFVALGAFEVVRQLGVDAQQLTSRHLAYASLERLTVALRAEARSATAVWASAAAAGAGHDDCVQLDFFAADAAGPHFWSYRTFPHHTAADAVAGDVLERLSGTSPIPACDPQRHGTPALTRLQRPPVIAAVAPAQLALHRDPYLGQPDSPFVASGVPATAPIALGVADAAGRAVAGGNGMVEFQLDTVDGSRVLDLMPGVFPSGFTEVLRYTCSERCDVGHDVGGAKTLTACAMQWVPGWSEYVRWNDYRRNPDGSLSAPGGWFIAGSFVFRYTGTRAADGGTDALDKTYRATNWDAARDYAVDPPDRPAADGSLNGSFAPWDVRGEAPPAWFGDLGPYLAAGESAPIAAERQRCDAVQQQGAAGGFYANG